VGDQIVNGVAQERRDDDKRVQQRPGEPQAAQSPQGGGRALEAAAILYKDQSFQPALIQPTIFERGSATLGLLRRILQIAGPLASLQEFHAAIAEDTIAVVDDEGWRGLFQVQSLRFKVVGRAAHDEQGLVDFAQVHDHAGQFTHPPEVGGHLGFGDGVKTKFFVEWSEIGLAH